MNAPGLLVINKPSGPTSRDVVDRVRRVTGIRRCGHAGTLDPLATGVLVICLNNATRLVPYIQRMAKTYRASFRFGVRSSTDDVEGELEQVPNAVAPTQDELRELLSQFKGEITQVPPKYSAVMVQGKRAYDLARQGEEFELTAKTVRIDRFDLLSCRGMDWQALIQCGSGTYVRSLGRDVGEKAGCGAVMTDLSREAIGRFTLAEAVRLEDLERDTWEDYLLHPIEAVRELPAYTCSGREAVWAANGRKIPVPSEKLPDGLEMALLTEEAKLIGIACYQKQSSVLSPRIVIRPSEQATAGAANK